MKVVDEALMARQRWRIKVWRVQVVRLVAVVQAVRRLCANLGHKHELQKMVRWERMRHVRAHAQGASHFERCTYGWLCNPRFPINELDRTTRSPKNHDILAATPRGVAIRECATWHNNMWTSAMRDMAIRGPRCFVVWQSEKVRVWNRRDWRR